MIVIQFTFDCVTSDQYAIGLLHLNGKNRALEKIQIVTGDSDIAGACRSNMDNTDFAKRLFQAQMKAFGQSKSALGKEIAVNINTWFVDNLDGIMAVSLEMNGGELKALFQKLLRGHLREPKLELELDLEEVEIEAQESRVVKNGASQESLPVEVELCLAPVSGIPVSQITKDLQVYIKAPDGNQILGLVTQNLLMNKGLSKVNVTFSDGARGCSVLPSASRVKRLVEEIVVEEPPPSIFPMATFFIALFVIILFIINILT
ncbi:MAG: hypothetical protein JKX97_07620 [Candidatus Lindowbacteria bacterium]|nr:hypothetical protein [Candidatus Lindowbacteria bacterium]